MTVRELCKAHDITTLDQQDELLARLAQDRDALLTALKDLVDETRDSDNSLDMGVAAYAPVMNRARTAIAQAERPR